MASRRKDRRRSRSDLSNPYIPRSLSPFAGPTQLPMGGRKELASRKPLLLPRPQTAVQQRVANFDAFRRDLRAITRRPNMTRPNVSRLQAGLRQRRIQFKALKTPTLSGVSSPCHQREQKKQIMFAKQIAGRSWSAGGPKMKGARRTINSSYHCTR